MKVYFHIGYPRTGSTFLQKKIFETHYGINYLGPKYHNPNVKPFLTNQIMNLIDKLDPNKELNIKISNEIFKNLKLSEKKINLISSEKFLTFENDYFKNLIKLKKLLYLQNGDISFKVFFVVRNQFDVLKSYYFHAFSEINKNFKIENFNELINVSQSNRSDYIKEFIFFNNYLYDKLYDKLKINFDKENIGIFFYEDLERNKNNFLKKVFQFLDIESQTKIETIDEDKINKLQLSENKVLVNHVHYPKLYKYYNKLNLKIITPNFIKNFLKKKITKEINLNINNSDIIKVKQFYNKSNKDFENITGLKLPRNYFT